MSNFGSRDISLESFDDDLEDYSYPEPDDDDDGNSEEFISENYFPEIGLGQALGAIASGGLSLAVPAAARALGVGKRPRTANGTGYASRIRGSRGGYISTPTGNARFSFPTSMVTKAELQAALERIGKDVRRNADAIKSTHKKIDAIATSTARDLKRVEGKIDKLQQRNQMQTMMSMFMQPELEKFTLDKTATNATFADSEFEVKNAEYEDNLMPMMMLMGGDMGGGDSSQNMMMAMMMAIMMNEGDD